MANIILFDFENHEIRFVGTAKNPEWIAEDVCKALDLDNTSKALETLDLDEKGITKSDDGTLTGSRMLTVTEKQKGIVSTDNGEGTPLQLLTVTDKRKSRIIGKQYYRTRFPYGGIGHLRHSRQS